MTFTVALGTFKLNASLNNKWDFEDRPVLLSTCLAFSTSQESVLESVACFEF